MAMDQEDASTNTLYIPSLDRESVSNTLSSSTQFLAKAYIVVDTNVLISHLCYIKELLERVRAVSIRLIVPWIVAQELDSLKRQEHIRTPIHFIHDTLHRGDPGLRGQKITEHLRKHTVNDDTILDCAQYFAAQSTSQPVLILSNDCNLRVKAMVHELCVWQCDEGSPEKLVNYLIAHYSSVATSTPASSNTVGY
ncbi:PIN domain-containing protein [Syncephalis plumigaleata]|nr:PIN domain-containing protein [Syncephalis plumigaleata]